MVDETEKWLRDNDPEYLLYTDRRNSEYPFHTNRQKFLREQKEIPVSNFIGRHSRRISLGNGNYKIDKTERPNRVIDQIG